jgi:hypothetical protein
MNCTIERGLICVNCRDDGDGARWNMLKQQGRVSLGGFTNWERICTKTQYISHY